jgi:hypothetical protein
LGGNAMNRRRIIVPLLVLHGFAIFTLQLLFAEPSAYEVPDSRANKSSGRLEEMERNADLVFKGKVISSDAVTNKAFPYWGNPHATKLGVITVLKGTADTNELMFLHITHGPDAWGGGSPPPDFVLNPGESYIVFAARADKPDYLYSPSSNSVAKVSDYRQLMRGIPAIRAADDRPVGGLSVQGAVWRELCGLLQRSNPAGQIYAVDQLEILSLAGRQDDRWLRSDDFEREAVLKAVQPLITNTNDMVAASAINCFYVGGSSINLFPNHSGWMSITRGCLAVDSKSLAMVAPHADTLASLANSSPSRLARVAAIAALSCTRFAVASNSLPRWLSDPDPAVRAQAVLLLPDFPGEFSERCLRERAADASAAVRAAAADAIGNGRMETLLPVLASLFSAAPAQKDSGPWPHKGLQGDGYFAEVGADDIHSSAGYALLKFDAEQVREILKTNLWDESFGLKFIRKLAPNGAEPYFPILARSLVTHTSGSEKEAAKNGFHWPLSYWLGGDYGWAWDTLLSYLQAKSRDSLAEPRMASLLDALQIADDPGDDRTRSLYKFLLDKGMIERAKELRRGIVRRTQDPAIDKKSFNFPEELKAFDKIDENHSLKPGLGL